MINLRVLVPEATINYIQNPAFRYATTGWNAVSATLTRSLDYARFGIASGKVVTNGSAANEGIYYRVSSLSGISDPITVSVYVRGTGRIRSRLLDNPFGKQWYSQAVILGDRWQRIEVSGFSTGSNDLRLYVETDGDVKAATFYVDGAQMERKGYSTSYVDGDQEGCRWNLIAHGSNSSRLGNTRAGGRWVDLAGPCRDNESIYVTVLGGFGMPPIENHMQPWAQVAGSYFQDVKVLDRVVTLSFFTKNEKLRSKGAPSLRVIHTLRQQLIDLFKPDRTGRNEPFLFEYTETDSEKPLYIHMRYEAGLEGNWDVRNQWVNSFPVRLIAVDPLWVDDDQEVKQLEFQTAYASASQMDAWGRINGIWTLLKNTAGFPLTNAVHCVAVGPDGTLYAGGNFTVSGLNQIARWTGENWVVLGGSGANNTPYALAVAPDGTVYATGDFTSIGGVACNRVAKYNPATDTWSAMGTGLNNTGFAICVLPNGQVLAGGAFTTADGITRNYLARWDGSQWQTVDANTINGNVRSIVNGNDGDTVYIAGQFTTPTARIMSYSITSGALTAFLDPIADGIVYALAVAKDGTLYAGGTFTVSSGAVDILRLASWSGTAWTQLSDGMDGTVYALAIDSEGNLYAGGDFTAAGPIEALRLARWNGNIFTPVDILPAKTGTASVRAIAVHPNGDLYIGLWMSAASYQTWVSKENTVTNPGTTEATPQIYLSGPGQLRYLENFTNGKKVYFDLEILASEEIFIDFGKATIKSTVRGDLFYTVLPGSDFRSFSLLPGDNTIIAFMTDDVAAKMQMRFTPHYWSSDGVTRQEAL